jgi:hypothetical protein
MEHRSAIGTRPGFRSGSSLAATALPNTPSNGFAGARSNAATLNYLRHGAHAWAANLGSNMEVYQSCLNVSDATLQGRGEANIETSIAQDPLHPNHLLAQRQRLCAR